ncbi:hypothetical protein G4228_013291 [Cervus hanglu yarkandensis]|nr:hypothetical protein G4228_013291 [Cervus hanglu yarkandensis]
MIPVMYRFVTLILTSQNFNDHVPDYKMSCWKKFPPKIYDISSDMTINEGTNVTLTCLATGKPEPSISWRHISPSAKPFENGQYLDIYGITRDQAGEYECSAENDVSFPDVKKVKIVVNFAPTIQEIKSGTVAPGRSGLIRCEGAGVPPPAFEWYKGEKKLFNGQQGIIIQNFSTRSILTVTNVTQEHFGNYTCVAVNKLGTTNASLPLNRAIKISQNLNSLLSAFV